MTLVFCKVVQQQY